MAGRGLGAAARDVTRTDGRAERSETIVDPQAALTRARTLAGSAGSVVVAGSLYLLEDLRDVLAGAG